jgi:hypothetical protein
MSPTAAIVISRLSTEGSGSGAGDGSGVAGGVVGAARAVTSGCEAQAPTNSTAHMALKAVAGRQVRRPTDSSRAEQRVFVSISMCVTRPFVVDGTTDGRQV